MPQPKTETQQNDPLVTQAFGDAGNPHSPNDPSWDCGGNYSAPKDKEPFVKEGIAPQMVM